MNAILKKRKQRIAEIRKKKMRARNRKLAAATLAGAIIALTFTSSKAGACSCSTDYTVKKGDTLYSLSKKYQVSKNQLMEANVLTSEKIYVGQQLLVPDHIVETKDISGVYTVKKGDTLFSLAKKYHVSVAELKKENKLKTNLIYMGQKISVPTEFHAHEETDAVYTVLPGDTLWGIAKRFGVTVADLKKANNLRLEMVLIGQKLNIPGTVNYTEAKVIGAVDSFTVEFEDIHQEAFVLKVPYGSASSYQKKSGQQITVVHKNKAVISIL